MRKVMMVTGAVRNTGLGVAERFLQEGYDVCITSRKETDAIAKAQELMQAYPGSDVLGIGMDPGKIADIQAAFAKVKAHFGRLDAFVPNAVDMANLRNTFTVTPDYWDAVMNVNVRGYFFCCQEAIKLMQDGGAIAMIGSVHAHQTITTKICYATSKGAILSMMHAMAIELAHRNIRVNVVSAGAIHTERWDHQTPEETQRRRDQYPSGRESYPKDIANAVYFLCSDQSQTITGTELTVDSGVSVCILPYNKHWNDEGGTP